jgi:hypothetical protein
MASLEAVLPRNHVLTLSIHGLCWAFREAATEAWEQSSHAKHEQVPIYRVEEVLQGFEVVDIIHLDIQGAERCLLQPATMSFLRRTVKKLHIGTHAAPSSPGGRALGLRDLHAELKAVLVSQGWVCEHEFTPANDNERGYVAATRFGPVRIEHDGELTLTNPALRHI